MSRREFQLIEDKSRKFWSIELDGPAHTVQFGRIGTAGQTQRKEFTTTTGAKASYDKLIAEKLKKGYEETTSIAKPASGKLEPAALGPARAKPVPNAESTEVAPSLSSTEPEAVAANTLEPISTVRSIELDPEDWLWATWRPRSPLPRPELKPFDLEDCLDRLSKVTRASHIGRWNWGKVAIAHIMTRAEAHFWMVAITEVIRRELQPAYFIQELRSKRNAFDGTITSEKVLRFIHPVALYLPPQTGILLAHLFSLGDLISLAREYQFLPYHHALGLHERIFEGFRKSILPYLSDAERRAMQHEVRATIGTPALPPDHYTAFPLESYLAAALGLHEEVGRVVRGIPDDYYHREESDDIYQRPQRLIFGLGDPAAVVSEMHRLNLLLRTPDDIRGWIAHTEDVSLDLVRESILNVSNREGRVAMIEMLALVKSPRTAGPMLELMLDAKAPAVARGWLDSQPGHAIPGLIALAAGRGKLADAALDYLRSQKRKGHEGYIRECLASAPPDFVEKVRREVFERLEDVVPILEDKTTPDWLRTACLESKKLKPPNWVAVDELRPILVDGHRLNDEQLSTVLAALAKSSFDAPQPLVSALKTHADRRSLDAFAWSLFERWLAEGAPSKEKWGMGAIGLFGSDDSALKLSAMLRAWPGESQHARAVYGLECLRAIGSDVALMQLNAIAQKLPFKGLKARATEFMELIAKDRGLTRAELEDRIVPDCDLDDHGGRIFDFGPRQFRFALGGDMKPRIRDEAGKIRDDLPRTSAKDDPVKADAAVSDWKRLKKQIRELAKVQAERLEQAMVTGRRWTVAEFEALLVRHPLMNHLVRLVVWGGYDQSGRLVSTFRVTEERDYADMNEVAFTLDGLAGIGVVHPLHLTDEQRSAWVEILGEYEIIPPFPQLGRSLHRLEPGREKTKDLAKGEEIMVPAVTLVGILERHGWVRGIPEDAGIFREHTKPFVGANVTAVIQYPGIPVGYMVDWEDQDVEKCFFVPGIYKPMSYSRHTTVLPLGSVDPVVISEVLGTLGVLASKRK